MNREDRSMNAKAREALIAQGHQFVELSQGNTHYQLTGPDEGELVVLVHGTSGPMTVWNETVQPLVEAGYRVLRFDFFGRGYSDRIDTRYDLDLHVAQLDELLTALKLSAPLHLVGSSLGAIVVAETARRTPELVRSLVFVGPAGFELEADPIAQLGQVAYLGDYLMKVLGDKKLVEHHRKYFVDASRFESYHQGFADVLRYRGTKAAILSTLRHTPLQSYVDDYAAIGTSGVPSLLVWGTGDITFPFVNHAQFQEAVPQAQFVPIDSAAHLPMLEQPAAVNAALLSFLSR